MTIKTFGTKDAVAFLNGEGADAIGRTITDYLAFDDNKWEECHNHIQWAFPSHIPSMYNAHAPVVDIPELVDGLTPDGIANVYFLLSNYMKSLGFTHTGKEWTLNMLNPRAKIWLNSYNHNYLRITRVLNLLHYIHQGDASYLLNTFLDVANAANAYYGKDTIGVETVVYWSKAAIGKL